MMTMNRRTLLFSTAAAAIASITSPVFALPGPGTISPIDGEALRDLAMSRIFGFAGVRNQMAFLLKSRYHYPRDNTAFYTEGVTSPSPFQELAFSIEKKNIIDDGIRLGNTVRETEHRYIQECPRMYSEYTLTEHRLDNKYPACLFELIRAQNVIAKSTRRGRGRYMIAHPNTVKYLESFDPSILNVDYYDDTWMKENEVFVFYRGHTARGSISYDVAGMLFDNGTVALNENGKNSKFDYGRLVVFRT